MSEKQLLKSCEAQIIEAMVRYQDNKEPVAFFIVFSCVGDSDRACSSLPIGANAIPLTESVLKLVRLNSSLIESAFLHVHYNSSRHLFKGATIAEMERNCNEMLTLLRVLVPLINK